MTRSVEATAPLRVDLAGGLPEPLASGIPGPVAVSVAIDRRAFCRVEKAGEGVRVESKDTLQTASAASVAELVASGRGGVAAQVLRSLGVERGVSVVTQARVPARLGLGGSSALALALAAAVARAFNRDLPQDRLLALARDAEAAAGGAGPWQAYHAARLGGAVALEHRDGEWRATRLRTDPGRVEECLLLLEAGVPAAGEAPDAREPGGPERESAAQAIASGAAAVREALACGRYGDVGAGFDSEWRARLRLGTAVESARVAELVALVRTAGGAARPCAAGGGGALAVWAGPGESGPGAREAVRESAREAGLKLFAARVDLLGLDVEETA